MAATGQVGPGGPVDLVAPQPGVDMLPVSLPSPCINLLVDKKPAEALVDHGAWITVAHPRYFKNLPELSSWRLKGLTRDTQQLRGPVELKLQIGGLPFSVMAFVADCDHDLVLGHNFIYPQDVRACPGKVEIEVHRGCDGKPLETPLRLPYRLMTSTGVRAAVVCQPVRVCHEIRKGPGEHVTLESKSLRIPYSHPGWDLTAATAKLAPLGAELLGAADGVGQHLVQQSSFADGAGAGHPHEACGKDSLSLAAKARHAAAAVPCAARWAAGRRGGKPTPGRNAVGGAPCPPRGAPARRESGPASEITSDNHEICLVSNVQAAPTFSARLGLQDVVSPLGASPSLSRGAEFFGHRAEIMPPERTQMQDTVLVGQGHCDPSAPSVQLLNVGQRATVIPKNAVVAELVLRPLSADLRVASGTANESTPRCADPPPGEWGPSSGSYPYTPDLVELPPRRVETQDAAAAARRGGQGPEGQASCDVTATATQIHPSPGFTAEDWLRGQTADRDISPILAAMQASVKPTLEQAVQMRCAGKKE
ncbi:Segmentation protein paired [Frankliniella fusca]|uniref:Segmentation protein paired n=1 Tax=Frankliniella fusca TaxID=407009 RepID=A0AAE1GVT6_9NEOP|nr:Segmentation protein paired [Frankliniella fusca]